MLAGPMIRRAESDRVCIWLATREKVELGGLIYRLDGATGDLKAIGATRDADISCQTVRLGQRLFVHLLRLYPGRDAPSEDAFPEGQVLFYDISVNGKGLRELGFLGEEATAITYPGQPLPSFFLPKDQKLQVLLHGSCRKLHSSSADAMVEADRTIGETIDDLEERPAILCLTGDQIYADDVGGPLIDHLTRLGDVLVGRNEVLPNPVGNLRRLPLNGRAETIKDGARFTSSHAENHLATFGEYAAMYLAAWSPDCWPEGDLPTAEDVHLSALGKRVPDEEAAGKAARQKYEVEKRGLEKARQALGAVRRVLANIPTYMMFDDHEVTDDWNITRIWINEVYASGAGRRIVANALAAYWAFQAWGNDPDTFDDRFVHTVEHHIKNIPETPAVLGAPAGASPFDMMLWSFHGWGFAVATDPILIGLDSRTQRGFDDPRGPVRLMNRQALDWLRTAWARVGRGPQTGVIFLSPTPIYGFEPIEELQRAARSVGIPVHKTDTESWVANRNGFGALMHCLNTELQPGLCIVLSGDVHYGFNNDADFFSGGQGVRVVQLVSSALKNEPNTTGKKWLRRFGQWNRRIETRCGWLPDMDVKWRRLRRFAIAFGRWRWQGPDETRGKQYWYDRVRGVRPDGSDTLVTSRANIGHITLLKGKKVAHNLLHAGAQSREGLRSVLEGDTSSWIPRE